MLILVECELDVHLCHIVSIAAGVDAFHRLSDRVGHSLYVACVVVAIEYEVETLYIACGVECGVLLVFVG